MARKPVTANQAAGQPQEYSFPGVVAGRKLVYTEMTMRYYRQLQSVNDLEGMARVERVVDMVFGLVTSPKVRVTEGEPFTNENVDELGFNDVTILFRFFNTPTATYEELTAPAATDEEGEDNPKAD